MSTIIGVDPGFTGAIAFLGPKDGLKVFDLPIKLVKRKKFIDEIAFINLVKDQTLNVDVSCIVIEDIGAMPGQGISSTSRFTYNAGILLGVLATLFGPKIVKVRPSVWKPALGLNRDKKKSLLLAKKVFSKNLDDFRLIKHDGRAEAALIAHFAKRSLF